MQPKKLLLKYVTKDCSGEYIFNLPPGGESFFEFNERPYEERPEFGKNLVIGSAGTNYIDEYGNPQTEQVILRVDTGHKTGDKKGIHINLDIGSFPPGTFVRERTPSEKDHIIPFSEEIFVSLEWVGGKKIKELNIDSGRIK